MLNAFWKVLKMEDNNKLSDNTNGVYYGVNIPYDLQIPEDLDIINVYKDKDEALQLVKKYKKARFRAFNLYDEAVKFSHNNGTSGNEINTKKQESQPQVGEKPSQFKSQTPQNLVILRKAIENGDVHFVHDKIWENPRYLIGSGDTPSILQEGARYNGLHVAAKSKSYEMCELLLNTVSNLKFIKKMYPDDKNPKVRAKMLLDLYLNTPDKGLNETPLHFAVKFGALKCVEVLVSFKQCDKSLPNKHGQLPKEIICARYDEEDSMILKNQIAVLLDETFYVPVLRTQDNCVPPTIGEPFTPIKPPKLNSDPLSPRLEIRAYAGPMDEACAKSFRKLWKTPPRNTNRNRSSKIMKINESNDTIASLKFRDPEKGLERVGNDLARKMEIEWKEYWSFLDCFVDIASKEGLDLLEKHLHTRMCEVYNIGPDSFNDTKLELSNSNSPGNHLKAEVSPMTELCQAFESFNIVDRRNSLDDQFEIFRNNINPLFYIDKSLQVFARRISIDTLFLLNVNKDTCHTLDTQIKQLQNLMSSYNEDSRFETVDFHLVHLRLSQLIKSVLINSLQDLSPLNFMLVQWLEHYNVYVSDEEGLQNGDNLKNQHASCILKNLQECLKSDFIYDVVNNEDDCVKVWKNLEPCKCNWKNMNNKKQYIKKICRKSTGSNKFFKNDISRKLFIVDGFNIIEKDGYSSSEDDYFTPPSSPKPDDVLDLVDLDDDNDIFDETQLPFEEVFIDDDFPTKTDWAVYNALKIGQCNLNSAEYPSIYKWYHVMSLCKESDKTINLPTLNFSRTNLDCSHRTSTPLKSCKPKSYEETPSYTSPKPWIRVTGVNSPMESLECHRGSVSFLD